MVVITELRFVRVEYRFARCIVSSRTYTHARIREYESERKFQRTGCICYVRFRDIRPLDSFGTETSADEKTVCNAAVSSRSFVIV